MSSPRRSNTRATTVTAETVTEGEFPAPSPPPHPVPMAQGQWAYATGEDPSGLERGVYRQQPSTGRWDYVAPLPHVLERLTRRDAHGRRTGMHYRLAMTRLTDPADVTICDADELKDGSWADRLDVALSADDKVVKAATTAIRDTARRHAHARELTPRWNDSQLDMPPCDVGPAGYGQTAPGESEMRARQVWAEIAEIAARGPKLALTLGASLGGLYVSPLRRQPFFLLLSGAAQGGKTTAATTAASMHGDPAAIVQPWNTTPVGLAQELGTMAVLPSFRDEFGAAGLSPARIEQLIFQMTEGAQRSVGGKTGIPRTSPPWHSVLVATGNDSILGQVSNEGIAARVLEVPPPITASTEDAERLKHLIPQGFGWPLQWLRTAGITPEGFADRLATAETQLGLPEGGVPRTIGKHLALAIAGAGLLDELLSTNTLATAALTIARELLAALISEAHERGLTPGERVLAAVTEALTARPGAYPTRADYDSKSEAGWLPREVEGWNLASDVSESGDLAVLTSRLDVICGEAGITNSRTGLRQLVKSGHLIPSGESDGRLRSRMRIGGWLPTVYKFRLDEGAVPGSETGNSPAEPGTAAPAPQTGNSTGNSATSAVNCENGSSGAGDAVPGPVTVFPVSTQTGNTTGNSATPYVNCENDDPGPVVTPSVPGVPGTNQQCHVREAPLEAEHVVLPLDGEPEPCRFCRQPAAHFDASGPLHPDCPSDVPAADSASDTRPVPVPAGHTAEAAPEQHSDSQRPSRRRGARVRNRRVLAGVLDTEGLWLPGNEQPIPADIPTGVEAAYRLAVAHDLRQLWFHPSIHDHLGIPASREVTMGPAEPLADPWADSDMLDVDPGGLAAWLNVRPREQDCARTALVFPAYDHTRTDWHQANSGRVLRDAVLRFADLTGEAFYLSQVETGAALLRHRAPEGTLAPLPAEQQPAPAGQLKHLEAWSRALLDEEDQQQWVHKYDLNGAELGVFSDLWVGIGSPEHHDGLELAHAANPKIGGYHRVQLDRDSHGLDLRLPDLLAPWRTVDEQETTAGQAAWITTDMLCLLHQLGTPMEVEESWIWPRSDRRVLRGYYERMRTARAELQTSKTEADTVALGTLKSVYAARIGDFNRPAARIYRPDIRDAVKSRRTANMYRRAAKIGQESGRYPVGLHIDALYYVSDEPDPHKAAPAGMRLGAQLGQYKPEGTAPLAQVRGALGGKRAATAFRRAAGKGGQQ